VSRFASVPHINCACGKRGFLNEHDAEKALGRAQAKRDRVGQQYGSRRGVARENRIEWCDLSDTFHLTAKNRSSYASAAA
jgi:hypothetical protein